jgi:hypothetical protein
MASKLTKAQRDLLKRIAAEPQAAHPGGRPAKALRVAGLAEWDGEAGSGAWWLTITPAGRAALQKAEPHER